MVEMNKNMRFSMWCEAKENRKVCVLMRGLPGSGKSYATDQVLKEFGGRDRADHVFSTDDFWIQDILDMKRLLNQQGRTDTAFLDQVMKEKYRERWNWNKLGEAHKWNFDRFVDAVDKGVTPVIVDNVNSAAKEMRDYAECAKAGGYEIMIREPSSPWWQEHSPLLRNKATNQDKIAQFAKILAGRNAHGVPEETIIRMLNRWQPDLTPEDILRKPPDVVQ